MGSNGMAIEICRACPRGAFNPDVSAHGLDALFHAKQAESFVLERRIETRSIVPQFQVRT